MNDAGKLRPYFSCVLRRIVGRSLPAAQMEPAPAPDPKRAM
jgi:hypothetical protein